MSSTSNIFLYGESGLCELMSWKSKLISPITDLTPANTSDHLHSNSNTKCFKSRANTVISWKYTTSVLWCCFKIM